MAPPPPSALRAKMPLLAELSQPKPQKVVPSFEDDDEDEILMQVLREAEEKKKQEEIKTAKSGRLLSLFDECDAHPELRGFALLKGTNRCVGSITIMSDIPYQFRSVVTRSKLAILDVSSIQSEENESQPVQFDDDLRMIGVLQLVEKSHAESIRRASDAKSTVMVQVQRCSPPPQLYSYSNEKTTLEPTIDPKASAHLMEFARKLHPNAKRFEIVPMQLARLNEPQSSSLG